MCSMIRRVGSVLHGRRQLANNLRIAMCIGHVLGASIASTHAELISLLSLVFRFVFYLNSSSMNRPILSSGPVMEQDILPGNILSDLVNSSEFRPQLRSHH